MFCSRRLLVLLSAFLQAILLCAAQPASASSSFTLTTGLPDFPFYGALIPVSVDLTVKHLPAIAYNTTRKEYLVVWHNTYDVGTRAVMGQRVSANGQLSGQPFAIADENTFENFQPSVAYDISMDRYLVVWSRSSHSDGTQAEIYGRFIPWDGPSQTSIPFVIFSSLGASVNHWNPKVAYTPWPVTAPSFLVVWNNDPPSPQQKWISGRVVNADGAMPNIAFTVASGAGDRNNAALAANPAPISNRYLVTYEVVVSGTEIHLYGKFVTASGATIEPEFPVSETNNNSFYEYPSVASCGAEFAVTYQRNVNQHDVYLQFIDTSGAKKGNVLRVDSTTANEVMPAIACGGSLDRYLVTWRNQFAGGLYGIEGRLAYSSGTFGPITNANVSVEATAWPVVASDSPYGTGSSSFLIAWEQPRSGASPVDVYGTLAMTEYKQILLPFIAR